MKNYFNDYHHFENFMFKVYKINDLIPDRTKRDFFIDNLKMVWKRNLHNKFTWNVKKDRGILNDIPKWLSINSIVAAMNDNSKYANYSSNDSTPTFDRLAEKIGKVPGVYIFSNAEQVIYVGRSSNLGHRVLQSFVERIMRLKMKSEVYFSYVITDTFSDAAVLELILIAEKKPLLNKATKYLDSISLKITHSYEESEKMLCKRKGNY